MQKIKGGKHKKSPVSLVMTIVSKFIVILIVNALHLQLPYSKEITYLMLYFITCNINKTFEIGKKKSEK